LSELEQALAASRAVESGVRLHVASKAGLPDSLRLAERRTWVLAALLGASLLVVIALGLLVWGRAKALAPTLAPSAETARLVENSVSIAADPGQPSAPSTVASEIAAPLPAASAETSLRPMASASALTTRKVAPKSKPVAPLERRGNERYGRFE
jgi:cytoskeletal protein RodZ